MPMPVINSFKKFIYVIVVPFIAIYFIIGYILHSDASIPDVEKFVASNGDVAAQIGNIKEFRLTKRVAVSATETSSAYRLYTFTVDGDKAKARIVVRADENGARNAFSITRFEVFERKT